MNKMTINWSKNLYNIAYLNKHILQGCLYSASACHLSDFTTTNKERIIRTYGKETIITTSHFSQFDLAFIMATKKIISQQNSFIDVKFSLSNLIRTMRRFDGGNTRRCVLNAIKNFLDLHLYLENNNGLKFEGCKLKKVIECTQNNFVFTYNQNYLSLFYTDDKICKVNVDKFLSIPLGLQSWLYGFFCSTPETTSIDIDVLHTLSGSNYKNRNDFKKVVKIALTSLEHKNIIGWRHGVTRYGVVFWEAKNLF